jgi:hypothetical protein
MSFAFCGRAQSATPLILVGSICTCPCSRTTPRYSIRRLWNSHLDSFRYKSWSSSFWRTRLTHCLWKSGLSSVAIRRSSMYTTSQPSRISFWKIWFIMAWKVAGELVSPKNITRGWKSPNGVMKAAFHSSPGLIRTLLYPHLTSNLVNRAAFRTAAIRSGIRGSG